MSEYQPAIFSKRPEVRALRPEATERDREVALGMSEFSVIATVVGLAAIAYALPFPQVKFALMAFFGVYFIVHTMRRPALGLALLAFGVPAIDLVPKDLVPIRGVNAETILTVALLVIFFRVSALFGKEQIGTRMGRVLGLYALLTIVSCFNSYLTWRFSLFDLLAAAKNHLSYLLFLPVAFHVAREKRDQLLLIAASMASLFLCCLQAIEYSWIAFFTGNLERYRASSLLAIQPNLFGAALALYLPYLVLVASLPMKSRLTRLWTIVLAGAVSFAMILTLSRGAWIGAVGGLALIGLVGNRKLLIVFAIAGATYQIWVPQAAVDRVQLTTAQDANFDMGSDQIADDSTQMRIEQYKSMWPMMERRPVLGWGYQSFPRVFEKYGTLQRAKGAHSTYVLKGVEEGILGVIMITIVFSTMVLIGGQVWKYCEDPFHRQLGLSVAAGAIAMALCMASGSRFEAQKIYVFFWIMFGIAERELALVRLRFAQQRIGMGVLEQPSARGG